jgi:hypothetical protein
MDLLATKSAGAGSHRAAPWTEPPTLHVVANEGSSRNGDGRPAPEVAKFEESQLW